MKTFFLQVKDVIQETENAITIQFWHPLSEQIIYKAGQFLTLIVPADGGENIRRSYSMSSSPTSDTAVAITVKRVAGGMASNYLCDHIKKGDFIEAIEPMGKFYVEPDPEKERHVVLIGAGSGITPLISMAKTILKGESKSTVSMIYGNRAAKDIIFRKELMDMEVKFRERFKLSHVLSQADDSWAGLRGRINKANIVVMLKDLDVHFKNEEFYLCGPATMMEDIIATLEMFEVPEQQINKENFNAPMLEGEAEMPEITQHKAHTVTVNYLDETYSIKVEPHQTVLEAALEMDIDLPYSCQAGMCTACLGKCSSGIIKMDEDDGLTKKEIEEGWVLTCVSRPMTDDVVIEVE